MFGKKSQPVVVESRPVVTQPVAVEEPPAPEHPVIAMAATATKTEVIDRSGEATKLADLLASLLPVEAAAGQQIKQRLEELEVGALAYPKLSIEPFTWRKDGLPVLAIYGLDGAICSIIGHDFNGQPIGHTPWAIQHLLQKDISRPRNGRWTDWHSEFTGIIPAEVRTKIAEAKPHFGDDIFIVAEANWERVERPAGDPLVVGWRADALWLIAQFDTTDLESYMVSEFPG